MKTVWAVKVIMVLSLIILPVSTALGAGPNAPTNLTGTVISQASITSIKLDWTDNSLDETSFRIERSPDGVLYAQLDTVDADVTSYVDDTVNPDVMYYYRVFAVNQTGDSNPSNVIAKYTLDTIAPPAPGLSSPPNGDQLDSNSVNFQWSSVSDMSGVKYRIVVNDLANGITLHDISGITSTNISLLLYDSNYEWYVTATDGAGNEGPPSVSYYLLVAAVDHMAPDTVVTAPNGGEELAGDSYFAITWYALDQDFTSTPDLKVQIFFSKNNGANWEQIVSLGYNPGAFNWHVPNINCDATCLIWVTTENRAGMLGSDASDFAFSIVATSPASAGGDTVAPPPDPPVTPQTPPNNAPSAPVLVFPANGQTGIDPGIACRWKKSQDPDGDAVTYRVHYCADQNFTNCAPDTVAANGVAKAFYAYAGLPGLLLMGAIFAVPPSGRKKFMFLMLALIIVGGTVVACSGGGGGDGENVAATAFDELSHQLSSLNAGTTYYWKVIADDGKGGSAESEVWSFTTQ